MTVTESDKELKRLINLFNRADLIIAVLGTQKVALSQELQQELVTGLELLLFQRLDNDDLDNS